MSSKVTAPLQPVVREHDASHGNLRTYVSGYLLSVTLTLAAYLMVTHRTLSHDWLVSTVVALALIQFGVQIVFFLHLGTETKPRWKQAVLWLMLLVVAILVFGSLWIMHNLNYNMLNMTPEQTKTYLHNHEGL